ncbi:MAG: hypothetical protein CYPHOPRED_002126, partial [Cyphobasidiales sp. Tagirdzhanova-0007]
YSKSQKFKEYSFSCGGGGDGARDERERSTSAAPGRDNKHAERGRLGAAERTRTTVVSALDARPQEGQEGDDVRKHFQDAHGQGPIGSGISAAVIPDSSDEEVYTESARANGVLSGQSP